MSTNRPCPEPDCDGTIGADGECERCGRREDDEGEPDRLPCPDGNCLGIAGPDGCCTECGTYIGEVSAHTPCPDESCAGVIGPDGRCTECGADADDFDDDDELADDEELDEELLGADADVDEADDKRIPCSDGSCIGIIGPDGRCTECGREK